jgi:hypothetical protein
MLQGNPEGLRAPIDQRVQEAVIAFIHAAYREGLQGFSVVVNDDTRILKLTKSDQDGKELHTVTLYYEFVLDGGPESLMNTAKIIQELVDEGKTS